MLLLNFYDALKIRRCFIISIHLMLLLNNRVKSYLFIFINISIHLMLLLNVVDGRKSNLCFKISIHLMLLLNVDIHTNINAQLTFQYILCCY